MTLQTHPPEEENVMTPQTYPLPEEVTMTPQTYPLLEEVAMTLQTCHLLGNGQGNRGRHKVKIHPPSEESLPHRHQVKNVHLILIGHHWQRGLRTSTIQIPTSHLPEKSH